MNKLQLTLILLLFFASFSVSAQKSKSSSGYLYTTAIGVKFYPGGITLKHFVQPNKAIEGIGYFWERGSRITGLFEIYGNINNAAGLRWYIGPGAHIAFYNTKYGGYSNAGLDGVLGLDYKFKDAPINLSIDWQPSFEFGEKLNNGFYGGWGGFAIRYTLK